MTDDSKTQKQRTAKRFNNPEPFAINYQDFKKWRKERHVAPPQGGYKQFNTDWYQPADFAVHTDAIWWLGHATALIKIKCKMILTDPIFSQRASPLTFLGPKRRTPCACAVKDLPPIDIIVISHNHYDHLDYRSIRQILKRFPTVTIVAPLGLTRKLQAWGADNVVELDWWQSKGVDGVLLTAIPARHWSRRALFDTNKSLWCGWMVEYQQRCIYFVGDTGYSSLFARVRDSFPNIDVALIPIGCYAPRWFMHDQHIDPKQALQLFKDVGCKRAIAIHWGAFELADDPLDEPPKVLDQLRPKYGVSHQEFLVLKIGDYLKLA